jgi:ABC-type multidrug transport system fused ATPase/permease subunit
MKTRPGFCVMRRLVGLVKPLAGWMLLAVLAGIIGHLATILIPVLGGYAMLSALELDAAPRFSALFFWIAVCALARGVLRYAEQTCNHYIAFRLLALIRDRVFGALRKLAPAKLTGREKGNLIAVLTSDVELLEVFYAHTISPVCIAFLLSVVLVVFFASCHVLLGLIALLAYAFVGIAIPIAASKRVKRDGEDFRSAFGETNAYLLDSIRGVKEILQYNAGESRLGGLEQRTDAMSGYERRIKSNAGKNAALTGAAVMFFTFTVFFASVLLYRNGQIGFEGVLILTVAMFFSFGAVIAVANLGAGLTQTVAAGNRVLDILDESPLVEDVRHGRNVSFLGAAATEVSFAYRDEPILKNLTIRFPGSRIIGVTGRSGSGKSTLLRLLMRYFDADTGKITISGTEISSVNTDSLRENESFVAQETELFHDSIANNIRIAKLGATHEEIVTSCKKASVHDFIMSLPRGYDTEVGELGETLSGGERQRLGLARAFLHDAPFLLLDEPTSNLDSLNEAVILKAVKEDRHRTTVLVSHRASTMRIADEVFSVENGRLS